MSQEKGRVFAINLDHRNFGKNFTASGNLWFFNSKDYVFDSQSERISNKNNTITTINKLTKQVIYDKNFENNLDIFNILSNANNGIQVRNSLKEKELIRINFVLVDWDVEGSIWTNQNTGEPKKISINISSDEIVDLEINSSKIISAVSLPYIDISGYEIIDLRD
tara:strand:- start:3934 stop:4428 length:495 start_codon:yes stop_codon:yes gene_type:complete